MTSRSREAFTVPMWGSTGPELRAHSSATCRNCRSRACGWPGAGSCLGTAGTATPSSPQLTGEERPTPRGSKATTS